MRIASKVDEFKARFKIGMYTWWCHATNAQTKITGTVNLENYENGLRRCRIFDVGSTQGLGIIFAREKESTSHLECVVDLKIFLFNKRDKIYDNFGAVFCVEVP